MRHKQVNLKTTWKYALCILLVMLIYIFLKAHLVVNFIKLGFE